MATAQENIQALATLLADKEVWVSGTTILAKNKITSSEMNIILDGLKALATLGHDNYLGQNVRATDSPTFVTLKLSGASTVSGSYAYMYIDRTTNQIKFVTAEQLKTLLGTGSDGEKTVLTGVANTPNTYTFTGSYGSGYNVNIRAYETDGSGYETPVNVKIKRNIGSVVIVPDFDCTIYLEVKPIN